MNTLEKFYSDAEKLIKKCIPDSYNNALAELFCRAIRMYDKQLLMLAEDIVQYWLDTHSTDSEEKAIDWFYAVFSLLDGSFQPAMDFSDNDWEALHAIINAHAETLDMEIVYAIMSLMLSRHKLS